MKKLLPTGILLICSFISFAQQKFKIEKIIIPSSISKNDLNEIPKVITLNKEYKNVAYKINNVILEKFSLENFNKKQEGFRFTATKFTYEISDKILFINLIGNYLGSYSNDFNTEFFFDLETGKSIKNEDLKFQSLFTLKGYLNFIENYWITDIKNEFETAIENCDGSLPYCTYYDIEKLKVINNKLIIHSSSDCYPHVIRACSPYLIKKIDKKEIEKYLTKQGYRLLFVDNYTNLKGIKKLLVNQKEITNIDNNIFIFADINGKYPISMALKYDKNSNKIFGFYYYDKVKKKINISGNRIENISNITEFVDDNKTENFEFILQDKYDEKAFFIPELNQYLKGTWQNEKVKYNIDFKAIKFTLFH